MERHQHHFGDHRRRVSLRMAEILKLLPDWFGNPQAFENYVRDVQNFRILRRSSGHCVDFLRRVHYGHTESCTSRRASGVSEPGIGTRSARLPSSISFHAAATAWSSKRSATRLCAVQETRMFYKSVGFTELLTLTGVGREQPLPDHVQKI